MTDIKKKPRSRLIRELEQLRSRLRLLKYADIKVEEAERAIATSGKFSQTVLNSLPANIAVVDVAGTIIKVNDSWIKFALENGVSSLDKVEAGVNYFEVCRNAHGPHSEEAPVALAGLESMLSGDRSRFELEYPCDSPGTRRWFLMRATRLDIDGQPAIVVSHVDITARKLAEEAIQRSNEALEREVRVRTNELERAKMEAELYLDVMSHDLLNINQALLGYLEIALDQLDCSDGNRELLTRPLELVQRSTDLITRVKKIRVSRRFDGNLKLRDLGKTISDIAEQFRRVPGRRVEINYSPVVGSNILANDLLPEIFINIIDNAIKHSDPGKALEINIQVKTVRAGNKDKYVVTIDDNGPGIPDDMKSMLFKAGQVDRRNFPGRGIGMFLVRNLAEMYGGSIEVRDRVPGDYSKGTCFIVTLPAAQPLPG
jgi:signal transduction histidine kinase